MELSNVNPMKRRHIMYWLPHIDNDLRVAAAGREYVGRCIEANEQAGVIVMQTTGGLVYIPYADVAAVEILTPDNGVAEIYAITEGKNDR